MPRRRNATAAVLSTVLLVVLDQAIANVALPSMSASLGAAPADTVWVVTAYQLALVMGILPAAAIGERFGLRRTYAAGLAIFTAGSAACALAPTLGWLVAARFVQGIGAAPLMALGIALLRFSWPQGGMGRVIGWMAMVVALGSALGPMAGAAILSAAGWQWLFAVNLPVGIAVLLFRGCLPAPPVAARRIDPGSIALNALAFGTLVLGADHALREPGIGLPLLAASAAGFAALVRRERRREAPLVPLDLLANPSFRLSVTASVCCFGAQMTGYIALPFLLQHGLGLSVLATGLCMTPWPLMVAVCGPLSGRLADRGVPGGALCAAGGTCLAAGLALAALLPETHGPLPLVPALLLAGAGFGLFQVPNNRNMLISVPKARSGAAGGMQGTARLAGQTAGGLAMGLLFAAAPLPAAPKLGLGLGACLALLGGAASLLRGALPAEPPEVLAGGE
ncbi:MFS transporter [Mangrovicoccus sp. HB161399]|uniref:MFS transporter n=1 Tax=Mangrovicoccus sp. HB161399 TaxID=2720392 RepID=UPI001C12D678|nr:MFS transporter [Mangrovicoccus sp. HB161399]